MLSVNLIAQKPKVKNEPNHDDRPVHFGFSLGLNTMDFRIRQSSDTSASGYDPNVIADVAMLQPGFHVHAISNFRLGKYFDFRLLPGISFGGERKITYVDLDSETPKVYPPVSIESNFIELPLLIKYKSTRINNFRPYIIGGTNVKFDLAATKKIWGMEGKNNNPVILNVFDYYFELGVGFDFYLEYFKFSTEIKYSMGMVNMMKKSVKTKDGTETINDPAHSQYAVYSNVIDKMNSRMFMISFHFE